MSKIMGDCPKIKNRLIYWTVILWLEPGGDMVIPENLAVCFVTMTKSFGIKDPFRFLTFLVHT